MIETADKSHTMEEVMKTMEPLISKWFSERFTYLTEPQSKAIPEIHKRKNVLVSSPTGSGKTLTAFTSIINELTRYASEGVLEERIYCVYISPLKALANDVNRNLTTPLEEMKEVARINGMNVPNIKVAVRSGDTPQSERQKMVRHPPHILITTPESLALMLAAPKFKENLKNVEWVILDEIHDICDSKRGVFLSLTLERLRNFCDTEFTRIGLSATLAPIEAIAGYLVGCNPDSSNRNVTLVQSDSKKELDLKVICPTEDLTALSSEMVNSMMYDKLKELVDDHVTTLVFTNTRSGAESVVYKLKERGLDNVEVHHSSLGKEIRLDVEERLKKGEIKCVVSSTSLELGIDIGSVDLVCQIGSPKSVAKGLQRIGRSGHSFGGIAKGRLIVFDSDDLVECAVMCRAAHRSDIDRVGIPENCLDVLSQTVVGMSLDNRWDVDEAYAVLKGSYCYRNLPREDFINVLRYLGSIDEHEGVYSKIWYDQENNQFGRKKGARMIYFMNLGTIPEEVSYRVITSYGLVLGELSEKFVERLSPRDVFVLGGRSLEFVRSKGMTAYVKEASGRKPTVPSWAGEMLPRSFDLSMDIAKFRKEMSDLIDENPPDLISKISMDTDIDEGSATSLVSYFREQKAVTGFIPSSEKLAIEEYIDPSGNQRVIFHYPFGRRVNDALSRSYAYKISNLLGSTVSISTSDDSFMLGSSRKINLEEIPYLLSAKELDSILKKAIKDSQLFKLRFRHTAVRSFMVLRNYLGRPIPVSKQQLRSSYLLDSLQDMENVPVIEETYREVLEDDMDIKNAKVILEMIDSGKMGVEIIHYSGTPSPFAHSSILSGLSDIVLMEDRTALLKELHRKVLSRALGDNIKNYEFEEDKVIPYFKGKIGRISSKSDIPKLLKRTGPLQVLREKGNNIYSYSDVDKKEIDGWVRELIESNEIGTVFLDEPYVMTQDLIPKYAAAVAKKRDLTKVDEDVYEIIGEDTLISEIVKKSELSEDVVLRSMRKLESMFMITRTKISANNRWYFSKAEYPKIDKNSALDDIVARFLGCYAPVTIQEVAFALSIPDDVAQISLDSLVRSEEAVNGFFLISEKSQYMKSLDYMRLSAGKENVFDFETIENYRFSKGKNFESIEDYFQYYLSAGSEIDVYHRVNDFDLKEWQCLRDSGSILLGRFVRGKVRFVLKDDGDRLAYIRPSEITEADEKLLMKIDAMGKVTQRELISETGIDKEELKESIMRLDKSLKIVRSFDEREDWGTENKYKVYTPKILEEDPTLDLISECISSLGPIPLLGVRMLLGLQSFDVEALIDSTIAEKIFVGSRQTPMYIMPDDIKKLNEIREHNSEVRILTLFDPDLGSKWAEISSRYGDRWIYPITKGNMIIGAMEIWEMSGCIEIRSIDLDNSIDLPNVLSAMDFLMGFFKMKGVDIVRIREIMNVDASELSDEVVDILKSAEYVYINGFYAKGKFTTKTFTSNQLMSYVFNNHKISRPSRHNLTSNLIQERGYFRSDQELLIRSNEKTILKKVINRDKMIKMTLVPPFVGYASFKFASLCRAIREEDMDNDSKVLLNLIRDRQPVSKKEIVSYSPFSMERTQLILSTLSKTSVIGQDQDSYYVEVPKQEILYDSAVKELAKLHFKEFGTFSAEGLASFMGIKMGAVRYILSELEREGLLLKGFLQEDDATLRWIIAEDVDKIHKSFTDMLILNTQDNLHFYLRDHIKREIGASECVVFSGTDIIASFKGKIAMSGAKMLDFKGSDKAKRYIIEVAKGIGVKIQDKDVEEDEDWGVSDFYLKTNPGA